MRKGSISRARDISEPFSPEPMAQGPGPARRCGKDGRGVDVARTGAAHLASPRTLPRHHADPGQSGGLPGEKGSLSPLHPRQCSRVHRLLHQHMVARVPQRAMMPRPLTEDIHLAGPGPVRRAPAAPCDGRAGGRIAEDMKSSLMRRPPAMGGPGPVDPNDLPPLAAGAETAPRGDLGGRPGRRPVHARSTTAIGPGRGGTRGASPAARPSRYGRRSALRQDAGCAPVEDRSPVTNSTSGGRLPAPSHDNRRTTPSGERARPQGHRGRPPGAAPSRPRRPQDAAHAASQRPYPLSRPVV